MVRGHAHKELYKTFYTTAEQEKELKKCYLESVMRKDIEVAAETKKTGIVRKHNMTAYVPKEDVVFYIRDGQVYYGSVHPDNLCTQRSEQGGQEYSFDPCLMKEVHNFMSKHTSVKITFLPNGRYGPSICYCNKGTPAILHADDGSGETLNVDVLEAYDILFL
eukprot:CAMPEP_0202920080 /NCGR_PEP_ID=MMETSP1392-20130828/76670_1 /ASSEMBLY_ACC=CAM_ASM_000868 /TAXON_ID=225041 /ORGANISM="Chlamydomonas chlamydogama, Strain SAG 11-48b" /LENGTH=162 /DNA_ID=CAMNT_0049613561 /DNA_START=88 /DNA_END=576 /DNA_ORIENTATION=+